DPGSFDNAAHVSGLASAGAVSR
ncbi:MAG: hypothetical protein QOG17_4, partial [Gammaproteobacteria bacterium]|nr:hypothetical protein [Gammaproteobacteria bacterium]